MNEKMKAMFVLLDQVFIEWMLFKREASMCCMTHSIAALTMVIITKKNIAALRTLAENSMEPIVTEHIEELGTKLLKDMKTEMAEAQAVKKEDGKPPSFGMHPPAEKQ